MKFNPLPLPGTFLIELIRHTDERGFFARSFCTEEFQRHGIHFQTVQCNISYNRLQGTIRGMHFQKEPDVESKLVRCTMGAIYDVLIDLRPDSPMFGRHVAVELSAENRSMLFVPEGLAHGFQTLEDDCEVLYQMGSAYASESVSGVRWDDPAFGIEWPLHTASVSQKDQGFPDFIP